MTEKGRNIHKTGKKKKKGGVRGRNWVSEWVKQTLSHFSWHDVSSSCHGEREARPGELGRVENSGSQAHSAHHCHSSLAVQRILVTCSDPMSLKWDKRTPTPPPQTHSSLSHSSQSSYLFHQVLLFSSSSQLPATTASAKEQSSIHKSNIFGPKLLFIGIAMISEFSYRNKFTQCSPVHHVPICSADQLQTFVERIWKSLLPFHFLCHRIIAETGFASSLYTLRFLLWHSSGIPEHSWLIPLYQLELHIYPRVLFSTLFLFLKA